MTSSFARGFFCLMAPVCIFATVAMGNDNDSPSLLPSVGDSFLTQGAGLAQQDDPLGTDSLLSIGTSGVDSKLNDVPRAASLTDLVATQPQSFSSRDSASTGQDTAIVASESSASNTWVFGAFGGALAMGLALTGGSLFRARLRASARW